MRPSRPLIALALMVAAPSLAHAADLTLKRVMLSSAGVGYFEYAAEVDGPATLSLDVPLDQVDDVLKSLVVFDEAGGVGGVELPGRDASRAAFGAVPFGPEALTSPVDLLNALQGVEISVQGPRPVTGRIVRAERTREPVAGGSTEPRAIDRTRVTLLGADGLRQFVLEDADSVQVADPALRGRIEKALEALRRDSGQDARHLTIRATGTGHRTVRVGYVAVAPLWKASYRLVLPPPDAKADAKARVQGWAVLENASGADWNGVELALQYGNPVTFHQAIYRSYFVARPEVPVEILGRLLPDIDTRARPAPMLDAAPAPIPMPPPPGAPMAALLGGGASRGLRAGAPMPKMAEPAEQAAVSEGMEETVFVLPTPVTLAAGHTSTVPILDREMPADRIAFAQPDRPHPLASVKLTNDSGLSLPAGVLTLYDQTGGAPFAGDARLGGLPGGESRLLSFAEDLRTTTEWSHEDATAIASLTAANGVMKLEQRNRHTDRIAITAPASEARRVLIDIPKRPGYRLVRDGLNLPVEETASAWRLTAAVTAGKTSNVVVREDLITREDIALAEDDSAIVRLMGEQGLTERARAALRHVTDLQEAATAQDSARDKAQADLDKVAHDEERLRANLAAVPANDALHGRLVRQLDADELRIAQLTDAVAKAEDAAKLAHQAVAKAVGSLSL
jgi:hypothetical protein